MPLLDLVKLVLARFVVSMHMRTHLLFYSLLSHYAASGYEEQKKNLSVPTIFAARNMLCINTLTEVCTMLQFFGELPNIWLAFWYVPYNTQFTQLHKSKTTWIIIFCLLSPSSNMINKWKKIPLFRNTEQIIMFLWGIYTGSARKKVT